MTKGQKAVGREIKNTGERKNTLDHGDAEYVWVIIKKYIKMYLKC